MVRFGRAGAAACSRCRSPRGTTTLKKYAPGAIVTRNVLARGRPLCPAGNYFPATLNTVGFVDLNGGNYALSSTSPYLLKGTEGKNLGADIPPSIC
jgi:hypothetical protein